MGHHKWTKMVPSVYREGRWPIRSMLWINKEVEAEQVRIESPDMTAAIVRLPDRLVLVVSVYVPGEDPQALRETCDSLRRTVRDVRRDAGTVVEVVIAGDFNRHDQLWGGDGVSLERQGEADRIIDLMSELALSPTRPPPIRSAGTVERLGDAAAAACMALAAIALGIIVAVNGANVIGRYFFNRPIAWAEELMLFLMIFIVFAGSAAVTWRQIHIRIDVVVTRLREPVSRWTRLLVAAVSVLVMATIAWAGFSVVSLLYAFDQRSDALEFPMWIPQSFVAAGMALNAFFLILRVGADIAAQRAAERL